MRLEVQEKDFPLVPQNVSRLKIYLNLKIHFDWRNGTPTTNKIKGPRVAPDSAASRPTRRKIVLQAGATIRVRLATYIIDSSKD